MLLKFVDEKQKDWDLNLPLLMMRTDPLYISLLASHETK